MTKTKLIPLAAALLLALAGAAWLLWPRFFPPGLPEGILEGHGRIEATEITVSSKAGGRIAKLPVGEGDRLEQGALVAVIAAEETEARLTQARERAAAAERQAQAVVEESRTSLAEAEARLRAAQERPRQLESRIEVLEHHVQNARADYQRYQALFEKGTISSQRLDAAQNAIRQAQGELDEARNALAAARAELAAARAARDRIAGTSPGRVGALEAEVGAAHAAHEEVQALLKDARVTAPVAGTVVTKAAEAGELAFPGQPLVVLADLDRPYLRVYLPERDIGKVKLGDPARVYVDSFPARPFEATVTEVAKKAEFTPKDVHMPDERVTLVYSVKLAISNSQGLLKPGMPADALIRWKPGTPWGR